jgi:isopenicillin-N N-acyltransferase-like protein
VPSSFKLVFQVLAGCLLMFLAANPVAQACTLFAAAGSSVRGGGTLIAKNRDRTPRASALRVFYPQDGYRHLGLVALDSPNEPAVAGINEKGLVVVDASVSCLDEEEEVWGAVALTQALLTTCASVDEVLAQKTLLRGSYPVFEMVADSRKVAWIEVAPKGLVAVKVSDRGALGHTNHYLDPQLRWANQKAHVSSRVRHRRIEELLGCRKGPFTFADFLEFSQDRHDGPDNSLNRLGSTPTETRTLATFVVQLGEGAPHVFVRMTNPGGADKIVNFLLEPALWTKGLQEKIL